ncbi:membrane protein [Lentibacillus kapialis]|uniref:Membrane protein n=1 Tax=Lentibacillus kapialis TaxID=340214 RepID=A0A917PYJ8_9BACI|nr:tripartite tricarboxylate transporter substrate binding protein [Lentibacillus kapialis]GGJ99324.1 membrane protein [Lentibacillus kapialis]
MRKLIGLAIIMMALVVAGCSSDENDKEAKSDNGSDFPTDSIEIIAPASPGGGWDGTARAMQKILSDEGIIEQNMNVVNKPGGGGEVGWQYLKKQDAHHFAINSSLVITNNVLGQSELTYEDFTPLATLTTEWVALATKPDSDLTSGKAVMEKLKEDPKSLKIGVAPSLGNDDHLAFVQAAKEFGVDVTKLEFLISESGGDLQTQLLGGHVDVATMSVSEAKEQHQADKLNIVAVSSEERIDGLDDVKTWKEQGVDITFPHWRGVMGPPDMTEDEIAYWDEKISEMVKTDAWQKVLDNNDWEAYYKDSAETKEFLKSETEKYTELLNDAGLTD